MHLTAHNFWKSKRVLITGHTGFKGSWLSIWLKELGAEICGYSLEDYTKEMLFNKIKNRLIKDKVDGLSFSHKIGDINDFSNLSSVVENYQPQFVFHLAAQSLVKRGYEKPILTWETNTVGTIKLLESLKSLRERCIVIVITTDKVYDNKEWAYAYREIDQLGGKDPYSGSKAAAELAVKSWRDSFCGDKKHQTKFLKVVSARAGNVIGGGDFAEDRIVPDAIKAIELKGKLKIRNPKSTRPWQHVLEPLNGYLMLAEKLYREDDFYGKSFNFGPSSDNERYVLDLIKAIYSHWEGSWEVYDSSAEPQESRLLKLDSSKAFEELGWKAKWDFKTTVKKTVEWYKDIANGQDPYERTLKDVCSYKAE